MRATLELEEREVHSSPYIEQMKHQRASHDSELIVLLNGLLNLPLFSIPKKAK